MKNRGQFFTPKEVANRMVTGSIKYLNKKNFEALDPCFGKGIFLKSLFSKKGIDINLDGYEIEKNFYQSVKKECNKTRNNLGFFDLTPFVKFDLSGQCAHEQLQYLCANNIKNVQAIVPFVYCIRYASTHVRTYIEITTIE